VKFAIIPKPPVSSGLLGTDNTILSRFYSAVYEIGRLKDYNRLIMSILQTLWIGLVRNLFMDILSILQNLLVAEGMSRIWNVTTSTMSSHLSLKLVRYSQTSSGGMEDCG
jgi:hypothetical protein